MTSDRVSTEVIQDKENTNVIVLISSYSESNFIQYNIQQPEYTTSSKSTSVNCDTKMDTMDINVISCFNNLKFNKRYSI